MQHVIEMKDAIWPTIRQQLIESRINDFINKVGFRCYRMERFGRSIFADFTSATSGHRRTREDMRVGAPCSASDRGPEAVYWNRDRVARTGARARRKIPRTTHSTGPPTGTTRQKMPAIVEIVDARAT